MNVSLQNYLILKRNLKRATICLFVPRGQCQKNYMICLVSVHFQLFFFVLLFVSSYSVSLLSYSLLKHQLHLV